MYILLDVSYLDFTRNFLIHLKLHFLYNYVDEYMYMRMKEDNSYRWI